MKFLDEALQWLARHLPAIGEESRPPDDNRSDDAWPRKLDPTRLKKALSAATDGRPEEQVEIFDELLESDPCLNGIYRTRKIGLTSLKWEISPTDETEEMGDDEIDPRAQEAADYCTEVLSNNDSLDAALMHLADAIGYSIAACEIVYRPGKGAVELSYLAPVQHRNLISSSLDVSKVHILTKSEPSIGIPVCERPYKYIVHNPAPIGLSPFRGGLLRTLAYYALGHRMGYAWWLGDVETFGSPTVVGKYVDGSGSAGAGSIGQGGASKVKSDLWKMINEVAYKRRGMFPKGTELELIQRQGQPPHKDLLVWLEELYAIAILGQTLTTKIGETGGAYAAAEVHERVRADILKSDIGSEARTIRNDLLRSLVVLKFGSDWPVPYWRRIIEKPQDLIKTGEVIDKAVSLGVTPTVGWVSDQLGVPLAEGVDPEAPVEKSQPDFGGLFGGDPFGGDSGGKDKKPPPPPKPGDNKPADNEKDDEDGEDNKKPKPFRMSDLPHARRTSPVRSLRGWVTMATRRAAAQVNAVFNDKALKAPGARDKPAIARKLGEALSSLPRQEFADALHPFIMAAQLFGYYVAYGSVLRKRRKLTASYLFAEPNLDLFSQPFEAAVRALSERLKLNPDTFLKLDRAARSRAGRIAGQFNMRMVEDVYGEAESIIDSGGTVRDFREAVSKIRSAKGWVGQEPAHADLVFRQNAAMSYGAGHLEAMNEAGLSNWRFTLYGDSCPICTPMDGLVFSNADLNYYPPLHFNCDCYADPVFEDDEAPVVASSQVNNRAYAESQERPGAFAYDPAQFGRLEPLNLSNVPAELRQAFSEFAHENGWSVTE